MTDHPKTICGDLANPPPALTPLCVMPNWLIWKWEARANGTYTKPPYCALAPLRHAMANQPSSWASRSDAIKAVMAGRAHGIGFALTGTSIAAIDIDHCRNAETGVIDGWAQDLIDRAPGAYVEVTVSGSGLRIVGTGNGVETHKSFPIEHEAPDAKIEIFRAATRYITVSGAQIGDCVELTNIDGLIDALVAEHEPHSAGMNGNAHNGAGAEQPQSKPWSALEELRVRQALGHIPADDRIAWRNIGMALFDTGWQQAFAIWDAWSRTSGKYNDEDQRKTWSSFGRSYNGKRVTLASLFDLAIKHGWQECAEQTTNGEAAEGEPWPKSEGPGGYRFPRVYRYGEVDYRAARHFLVQGVIPETCCGLISGQWGTFKTFVALYLAYCVMTGELFLGSYKINRPGAVLFIALEGIDEVSIRIQGIADDRQNVNNLPFEWVDELPPGGLLGAHAADNLCGAIAPIAKELEDRFALPLSLILIDTLIDGAGYSREGQESDAAAGQVIMNTLAEVARRLRCAVLAVDHFGKDVSTGTRGSSAKEGRADVVLAMLGDKSVGGEVTNTRLALRKRRGGRNGEEFPFIPRLVDMGTDAQGEPLSTLVMDWGDAQPAQTKTKRWTKSLQLLRRILMTMLAEHGTSQQPFADGPTVRAVNLELVRAEFCRQYPAEGDEKQKGHVRRQAFYRALKAAQEQGLIAVREVDGTQLVWLVTPEAGGQ